MANSNYPSPIGQLIESLSAYSGVTTANGAANGTTLVDSGLVGLNDFITNQVTVLIQSGNSWREVQPATGFVSGTGTITCPAFSHQILAGTSYRLLHLANQVAVTSILAAISALNNIPVGAAMTLNATEHNRLLLPKTNTSPLTSGTLSTMTGTIAILGIIGRVTTAIQAQATTCKISEQMDSLHAVDLCATLDLNGFAVGSALSLDGTNADAMIGATGVPEAVLFATPKVLTCTTSGIITVTFGAASTGAIAWNFLWMPLDSAGSLT
jgi:hypothetical protein